jgi:hypothetical protein
MIKCPDMTELCKTTVARRFHLEQVGAARYRRLYKRLMTEEDHRAIYAIASK